MLEEKEYDSFEEMEIIISGYDELCAMLELIQGNTSEFCYLPVNLLAKLNEQLRDHYSELKSNIRMHEMCEYYRQELKQGKKPTISSVEVNHSSVG